MPSPIQKLRALTKRESTHEHYAAYIGAAYSQYQPPGRLLILTANVETALETAITKFSSSGSKLTTTPR